MLSNNNNNNNKIVHAGEKVLMLNSLQNIYMVIYDNRCINFYDKNL